MSGLFFGILLNREIPVLNADSVGPDQTPRSAASDLGLHCLPFFFFFFFFFFFAGGGGGGRGGCQTKMG